MRQRGSPKYDRADESLTSPQRCDTGRSVRFSHRKGVQEVRKKTNDQENCKFFKVISLQVRLYFLSFMTLYVSANGQRVKVDLRVTTSFK